MRYKGNVICGISRKSLLKGRNFSRSFFHSAARDMDVIAGALLAILVHKDQKLCTGEPGSLMIPRRYPNSHLLTSLT